VPEDVAYVEQYCESCEDETDQQREPELALATCLRCGARNPVRPEDERIAALIQRVRDDEGASLGRLRTGAVPGL
jgi:hypothetical protein